MAKYRRGAIYRALTTEEGFNRFSEEACGFVEVMLEGRRGDDK